MEIKADLFPIARPDNLSNWLNLGESMAHSPLYTLYLYGTSPICRNVYSGMTKKQSKGVRRLGKKKAWLIPKKIAPEMLGVKRRCLS